MGLVLLSLRRARRLVVLTVLGVASFAALGFLGAPTVRADNTLLSSDPANGATLAASPAQLTFRFAEPLGPQNQPIVSCNGEPFAVNNPVVAGDGVTLQVQVPTPMPKGTCSVVVKVSGVDATPNGQVEISFNITGDAAVTPTVATTDPTATTVEGATTTVAPAPTTSSTDDTADPGTDRVGGPLGLSRLLAMFALATVFGGLVLIVTAWPEGVEYILTVRFLRLVWLAGLAGSVLTTIFLTAQVSGRSVGASISPTSWRDLADSWSGVATLLQVAFAAGTGWVVTRPERVLDPGSQLPALAVPGLAVAMLGLMRSGGSLALVGAAAGMLHALAMAVWLGGVVLLSRVVLAGPGEEDLVHAVRGFGRIATPALVVTVLTGAIQTWRLDRGALFDSSHGQVLLLKALLVGVVVFVGLATRQFVSTRLRTADTMTVPMASRLRRATGIEAAGGLLVMLLTSWLLSLTPPGLVDAGNTDSYSYTGGHFVGDGFDATISVTGEVGPNGVKVEVTQPATGLSNFILRFIPPVGANAAQVVLTMPAELAGTGTAVLPEDVGVPLDVAGVWTLDITVTTPTGQITGQKTFTVVD
jgi:copper transport protein